MGHLAEECKEHILQLKLARILLTPKQDRMTWCGGFQKGQIKVNEAYSIIKQVSFADLRYSWFNRSWKWNMP